MNPHYWDCLARRKVEVDSGLGRNFPGTPFHILAAQSRMAIGKISMSAYKELKY